MDVIDQSIVRNNLLSVMDAVDFASIRDLLSHKHFSVGEILFGQDEYMTEVFFVESGIVSVVAVEDDHQIEVGIYGFEGMGATASILQADRCPQRHVAQISGSAWRIDAHYLNEAIHSSRSLTRLLLRYAHNFTTQTAWTTVANSTYYLDQRLARWLLMVQDRMRSDRIDITHQFLATMLAAQRSTVTDTVNYLEGLELIKATRGRIAILNRAQLMRKAGKAYGVPEGEYRRLIGPSNFFE